MCVAAGAHRTTHKHTHGSQPVRWLSKRSPAVGVGRFVCRSFRVRVCSPRCDLLLVGRVRSNSRGRAGIVVCAVLCWLLCMPVLQILRKRISEFTIKGQRISGVLRRKSLCLPPNSDTATYRIRRGSGLRATHYSPTPPPSRLPHWLATSAKFLRANFAVTYRTRRRVGVITSPLPTLISVDYRVRTAPAFCPVFAYITSDACVQPQPHKPPAPAGKHTYTHTKHTANKTNKHDNTRVPTICDLCMCVCERVSVCGGV